jgi:hypothetical protein
MKQRWHYVPVVALIVAVSCLLFDWHISARGHLDLTFKLFGLAFGFARESTESSFYWFGKEHLVPLDVVLYSVAFIAVCFTFVFCLRRVENVKRFIGLALGISLAGSLAIHIYFRFHLNGEYDDLQMACDCRWLFKDGQIFMVTVKGRSQLGTYTRSDGRWICQPLKGLGGELHMQPSLLGIWWQDSSFQGGGKFLPRRCFSPIGVTLYDWYIRI